MNTSVAVVSCVKTILTYQQLTPKLINKLNLLNPSNFLHKYSVLLICKYLKTCGRLLLSFRSILCFFN